MDNQNIIVEIEKRVAAMLTNVDAGHDMTHINRVRSNASAIQKAEGGNDLVIDLAVLLHDVVDDKLFNPTTALLLVKSWFVEFNIDEHVAADVIKIITNLSFSKELDGADYDSLEFRIVQDADRLDAIGAIGIARAFSYGNEQRRPFFNASALPTTVVTKAQYRSSQSATLNHFFEKLLKIRGLMKTATGKQMATERHRFMVQFLFQYIDEVNMIDANLNEKWQSLIRNYDN